MPPLPEVRAHIDSLKASSWLGSSRSWWPQYLFHCTDVRNAVSILRGGQFLSRRLALDSGALKVDIASPEIISGTDELAQNHVRLYFRPRTPTQYRNEGFRPASQVQLGAQCPMPVYFLLDAYAVLSAPGCRVSEGNMAGGTAHWLSSPGLSQIDFKKVYHDSPVNDQDRAAVIFGRNAEVLIPDRSDLPPHVRHIVSRTQAEYLTLLHYLPYGVRTRWSNVIGLRPNLRLFFNEWASVDQVELTKTAIGFKFNPGRSPGSFKATVDIVQESDTQTYEWKNNEFTPGQDLELTLSNLTSPTDYSVTLMLDGHPAFAGRFQHDPLPF